jgi:hypothetical protein
MRLQRGMHAPPEPVASECSKKQCISQPAELQSSFGAVGRCPEAKHEAPSEFAAAKPKISHSCSFMVTRKRALVQVNSRRYKA